MAAVQEALLTRVGTKVVAATGTGKGLMIGELVRRMKPTRALVMAHVKEIIWQLKRHVDSQAEINCGVEMAELSVNEADLFGRPAAVVSTVQTQYSPMRNGRKRMSRFDPNDFGLIVADELHHFASDEFVNVINYYSQNPALKFVGFTATPNRHDGKALPPQFAHTAFDFGIIKALEAGWLVDVTQQFVPVSGLDYSHVKTKGGDLDQGQLAQVLEAEEVVQGVCQPTLEVIFGLEPQTLAPIPVPEWGQVLIGLGKEPRKTIVFCVRVQHAEALCNIFNRVLPKLAAFVSGKTNRDDRDQIFKNFASGATPVLANVAVIGEGIDIPGAEVCVMARPTKSLTAYLQWIGRVLRPLPGVVDGPETPELRRAAIEASAKPYARIVDFVGNSGRHKIINSMDALGAGASDEVKERALRQIRLKGKPVRVLRSLANAKASIEEEQRRAQERAEAAKRARIEEEYRKLHLVARSQYSVHEVDPFGGSVSSAGWASFSRRGKPLTEKQANILRRRGYNPDEMQYGHARRLIGEIAKREGWGNK
jgi:superfamily II DNA or RNA helicase